MRVDSASRSIAASPAAVFGAFAEAGAMERWLPPTGMTGEMLRFDFREGGSYRMRLAYVGANRGRGKSTEDADIVDVRITGIVDGRVIEQEVVFESEDPAFAGVMRMVWEIARDGDGTRVTVRAENVPEGVRAEDHEAAMRASLANLARFVEEAIG